MSDVCVEPQTRQPSVLCTFRYMENYLSLLHSIVSCIVMVFAVRLIPNYFVTTFFILNYLTKAISDLIFVKSRNTYETLLEDVTLNIHARGKWQLSFFF